VLQSNEIKSQKLSFLPILPTSTNPPFLSLVKSAMSPVKPPTRTTRQGTTRASTQARREISLGSETHVQTSPREPESRSRRSTSPISSLSPSPQKIAHRLPIPPASTSTSIPARARRDKGKGKAVEPSQAGQGEAGRPGKRVLPARIRRAAGGGQEGFRDLEDIIVDWLDRYGMSTTRSRWKELTARLPERYPT
jgi:hypothetical protein